MKKKTTNGVEFDTVERTYNGRKLIVRVREHEVVGEVDGSQVYGVYYDRGKQGPWASMAKASSGPIASSFADIVCMSMVMNVVNKMFPPNEPS